MSDTKFHIRYRISSTDAHGAVETFDDWTEGYGSAVDFRTRLDWLAREHELVRDALGNPDADGSWIGPYSGLRLDWWIQ